VYLWEHNCLQAFERGHSDTFNVTLPDLGKLKKVAFKLVSELVRAMTGRLCRFALVLRQR
jgi:hypothetical protein